jgi:hypothetical protein
MGIPTEKVVERSVDNVQKIYAVIIALAIAQAIQNLLKSPGSTTVDLSLRQVSAGLPAFIAFLVTLVPFWQGMNRHLDRCYLEKTAGVRQRVLLLDFAVFFVEAIFLFAAGWSIKSDIKTFYWLGGLLGVDTVWSVASHYIHFPGTKSHSVKWAAINVCAIVIAIFVVEYPFQHKEFVLMVIAVGRSIADYVLCGDFYFPSTSNASSPNTA